MSVCMRHRAERITRLLSSWARLNSTFNMHDRGVGFQGQVQQSTLTATTQTRIIALPLRLSPLLPRNHILPGPGTHHILNVWGIQAMWLDGSHLRLVSSEPAGIALRFG